MAQTSGDLPTPGAPAATPSVETPQRAVFRMPFVAVVLLPLLAAFCLGPIATVNAWWAVLFVIPVLIGVAVVLTRTVVDGQAITVHGLRPQRRLPWTELDRLEFSGPRWAVAVSTDERRMRLPMVRPRDLPVLAAVSGGYLTFTAPPVPDEEPEPADDVVAGPDGTEAAAPSGADERTDVGSGPERPVSQERRDDPEHPGATDPAGPSATPSGGSAG